MADNLKKYTCEVCGKEINESRVLFRWPGFAKGHCSDCDKIIELRDIVKNHWDEFRKKQLVAEENEFGDWEVILEQDGITSSSRELGKYSESFDILDRTQKIKDLIENIDSARRYLYFDIAPFFEILESTFDKKNVFWRDGGNMFYYIRQSLVSKIVIHLADYLDSSKNNLSKYSLKKIRNNIENDKANIYQKQQIYSVHKFEKSGHEIKTKYDTFPINDYLSKINDVLSEYESIIIGLKDYRDNNFAHIGELKFEESKEVLTLINLRRIFNSLKIIYDGLIYSVAPDKYTNLSVNFNMSFDYINQASIHYKNYLEKKRKNMNKLLR